MKNRIVSPLSTWISLGVKRIVSSITISIVRLNNIGPKDVNVYVKIESFNPSYNFV